MHGVSAHTGFPRTLTMTSYLSALFSTLNPILSVTNLSRLECAETQCARKPRAYEYETSHLISSRISYSKVMLLVT
jgi:hypothetical protein